MATTAIFAELLVIGLQVVVWLTVLLFAATGAEPAIPKWAEEWSTLITLLVFAAAYVLGVLMDRISDSVFKLIDKDPPPLEQDPAPVVQNPPARPFRPKVSIARLTVANTSDGLWPFLEYIRSRLRIARATAVNLAITTPAVLFLLCRRDAPGASIAIAALTGVIAVSITFWTARRISKTYHDRLMEAYDIVVPKSASA